MTTPTELAASLLTVLEALDDVDYASINDFYPPIKTRKVALIIPPFRQEYRERRPDENNSIHYHRIPCEFWVKIDAHHLATINGYARDIAYNAVNALFSELEGGILEWEFVGNEISSLVEQAPVTVGNAEYIIVVVTPEILERYCGDEQV